MPISAGVAYVDILPRFKKFAQELQKQTAGAGSGLKKFGDGLSKAGNKLTLGLTVPLVAFAAASVKAFTESETALTKLQNTIDNNPKLAGVSARSFAKLADAIQRKTAADDESVISGIAVLGQFDLTAKQIREATPLIVDYARKTGKDIPAAASAVGRALLGNARALKEIGINFKSTGDAGKDFETVFAAIRSKVGGFAEQEGKTAAGQAAILKNQFNEMQETIGEKLLPIGIKLLGFASKLIAKFSNLSPQTQDLALKLGFAALALGPVVKLSGTLFKTLGVLKKGFALARAAIVRFTGAKLAEKTALEANNKAAATGATAIGGVGKSAGKVTGVLKNLGKAIPVVALGVAGMEAGFASARKETEKNAELVKNKLVPAYLAGTLSAKKLAEVQKIMEISGNKAALAAIKQAIATKTLTKGTNALGEALTKVVQLPPLVIKTTTPGMAAALSNLNKLRSIVGDIGTVGITIYSNQLNSGMAAGGSFTAADARRGFWTGEKGPEFVTGTGAGKVIPNYELGGMGSSMTNNFYISGLDAQEIGVEVERTLQRVGRRVDARQRMRGQQ
jgi:hypothetical protein